MGYEMAKLIADIVFGACAFGLGLYYLITPYEKLKEKFPKIKSEKMIKTCGVLLAVIGVFIVVAGLLGLI